MAKNSNCVISDTTVCKWLNKECAQCYVNGMKSDDDKRKVLEDFEVMLSLIPEEVGELQGDTCAFCMNEAKPRAGYAIVDLGHSEPEHKKGAFFGLGKKVRQRIGSLLPLSISVCKQCRRNLRMVDHLKWISIVVFVAIAIGVMFIPGIANAIGKAESPLPYAVVIAGGIIGYVLGKVFSNMFVKAKKKETRFHVFDIAVCEKMREMGWFVVQDDTEVTRYVLSKKPFISKIEELKNQATEDDGDFTQTSFLEH